MLRRLIVNIANQLDKTLRQKAATSEVIQSEKAITLCTPAERKPKLKRKKRALLTVYSGKGYHGVQIQITGHKMIELELVNGLHTSNLIDQSCADDMSKTGAQIKKVRKAQ